MHRIIGILYTHMTALCKCVDVQNSTLLECKVKEEIKHFEDHTFWHDYGRFSHVKYTISGLFLFFHLGWFQTSLTHTCTCTVTTHVLYKYVMCTCNNLNMLKLRVPPCNSSLTSTQCVNLIGIIRTHGSGSYMYVGLAPWGWFSIKHFKIVTNHYLYLPART